MKRNTDNPAYFVWCIHKFTFCYALVMWETFHNSPLFLWIVEICYSGMNFPGSCNVSYWTPCDRYSWRHCQHTCIMPWLMHSPLFLPHSHPPPGSLSSYQPSSFPFSFIAVLALSLSLSLCACACVCGGGEREIMEPHFTCITITIFQCSVYWHFQNLKLTDLFCMKTF
jgi:hypothetical protein